MVGVHSQFEVKEDDHEEGADGGGQQRHEDQYHGPRHLGNGNCQHTCQKTQTIVSFLLFSFPRVSMTCNNIIIVVVFVVIIIIIYWIINRTK